MIQALIFDCFGVLYLDNINKVYNLFEQEQYQEVNDLYHAVDHGFITTAEFFAQLAELSGKTIEEIRQIADHSDSRNHALVERITELKKDYKIGLLSNMGHDTLDEVFSKQELETLFDSVVISSVVGMIKPSRDIYEFALEQLGTEPEETVFIDDRPANIDGAEVVGMKTILYTGNQQFERELTALTANA